MSPGTSDGGEYQERDDKIVGGLNSEDPQKQRDAMISLHNELKGPLLVSLRNLAKARPLGPVAKVFKAGELKDLYHETMVCILRKRGELENGKSLLSLLISIASRRASDRRRKLRREAIDASVDAEIRAVETRSSRVPESFWDALKVFLQRIPRRDKNVLRLDVELKDRGDRGDIEQLLERLRAQFPGDDWERTAVLRQRTRLREKFRQFLETQGYNLPRRKRGHDV